MKHLMELNYYSSKIDGFKHKTKNIYLKLCKNPKYMNLGYMQFYN